MNTLSLVHKISISRKTFSLLALALATALNASSAHSQDVHVNGTVWQVDNATVRPHGQWDRLGATELLLQWTAVDNLAFVNTSDMPMASILPDWQRIAAEPWARDVIVGLSGRFGENAARDNIDSLIDQSVRLAKLSTPLHVVGYYFPVEIDPTWQNAAKLGPLLNKLPRPLWISVYDTANVGPNAVVDGLQKWLPSDVGVFFQDGVGVYARGPEVARYYADVMSARLGKNRFKLIAEAFRPKVGGGFRSATAAELKPQLQQYDGYSVYLFDGPHYVSDTLVQQLIGGNVSLQNISHADRH